MSSTSSLEGNSFELGIILNQKLKIVYVSLYVCLHYEAMAIQLEVISDIAGTILPKRRFRVTLD